LLTPKKWVRSFALLIVASLIFSACGTPPPPGLVATQKGGTIVGSTFGDVEILNPVLSVDSSSAAVNEMLYNGLVQLNPEDGSIMPDLAERWDVSDDSLTFTFYLRKDVKWHDGAPFTAHDVKFTFDTILDKEVNSPCWATLAPLLTPERIVVLDDYTIRFQLSQVDAAFLVGKVGHEIIPRHILGGLSGKEFKAAEFNTQSPVGTGPFMFHERVKGAHITLVKNPNYFKGAPNIDFWRYKVVENQTAQFTQLQTGVIDYASVASASWAEANQTEILECKAYPNFGFHFYIYQLDPKKTPLFLDVHTRQALLYALDREVIVEKIGLGLGDVAHSVIPPLSWAHNQNNEPRYDPNPEKAKELLNEAGWKDEDGDGIREAHGVTGVEDGTSFTFEIHTNAGNEEREQLALTMQQYWNEVGVGAETVFIEWSALLAELTEERDYEVIVVGFGWGIDPDQKTMWHTDSYGGGFNMNKYSNERVDEILDAALLTTDREERKALYFEMQQILAKEVPAPILFFRRSTACWNKRLHGRDPNAINTTWNAHEWWVEQ
jgi:peptide/nickel transport system substrate-binding protein